MFVNYSLNIIPSITASISLKLTYSLNIHLLNQYLSFLPLRPSLSFSLSLCSFFVTTKILFSVMSNVFSQLL